MLPIAEEKTIEIVEEHGLSKYLLHKGCALYSYDQLAAPHDVGAVWLLALLTRREASAQLRSQEVELLDGFNFGQSQNNRTVGPAEG
ncbi:MAG: hypothetical protein OSA43_03330 [Pirellulales bacterium]|nr:hypothetical protein [Pirellulales bacterium]